MIIRDVTSADAQALLDIYAPYVTDTAVTFEYDVPSIEEFSRRIREVTVKYPYLAAVEDGRIVGYVYAKALYTRSAYAHCVETSIYVSRSCRRGGIGRALYEALEDRLRAIGIVNLYACIAYPLDEDPFLTGDSVQFHARMGYTPCGQLHRCGWKFGRWYDVVFMEKMIASHDTVPLSHLQR